MTLRRLTGLEREKIELEHKETLETITRLKFILANESELLKIISAELEDIKKEFGDPRRTQIVEAEGDFSIEDLIVEEDMLVTVTHGGYIKRTPLSALSYAAARRPRQGRGRHRRRGFRRASRARLDSRSVVIFHYSRASLPAKGV